MNPEIKEKWIAALRSGEYEQGNVHLRQAGRYCCLGVLCELAVAAGAIPAPVQLLDGEYAYDDHSTSLLPRSVQKWAGIHTSLGRFDDAVEGHCYLSDLNDSGLAFPRIADVIEGQF